MYVVLKYGAILVEDATRLRPCLFNITPAEIGRVVEQFYASVRSDKVLGPVFNAAIEDWPAHEAKIAAFWRGAILREPGYGGNPMQVHLANSAIKPAHFSLWLDLFRATVQRELRPEIAAAFFLLANRIGKGMSSGIENFRRPGGSPPILT